MVRHNDPSRPATFADRPEPTTFYRGPAQEEALARLEWLVEQRQRCGHLAVTAARRLGGLGAEVVMLSLAGLPEGEWLELLLDRLSLDPESRAEPIRSWLKLENRLRENTLLGRPTVLVLEDLDRGPVDAQEAAARLITAAEPRFATVTVIATARTDGVRHVADELRSRAAVRVELPLWNEADVVGYLQAGLERTGRPGDLFTPTAAATMLRFARGVPQVVGRLAELALAAAEVEDLEQIDSATIESVWRELAAAEPDRRGSAEDADTAPRFRAVRRLWS
jgi:hypothetical protein